MGKIKNDKRKRAAEILKKWSELDALLPPCEFCGRCVLVGVCCSEMLAKAKSKK